MWSTLASLVLNRVNNNNAEEQQQEANDINNKATMLNSQRQKFLSNQQPSVTQNGHIDMQSIIDGVFTKNKNNNGLPSGFLGA